MESFDISADIRLDLEMMKASSHSTTSLGSVKRVLLADIVGLCKHLGPGRYVSVINDNH
jgi:hypothetical protein